MIYAKCLIMKEYRVKIIGVDCPTCVYSIERELRKIKGFTEIKVDIATGEAVIKCNSDECSISKIYDAIREAGYDLYKETLVTYVNISPEQVGVLEKKIAEIKGVIEAKISSSTGLIKININPLETNREAVYNELLRKGVEIKQTPEVKVHVSDKITLITKLVAFALALTAISYSMISMLNPSIPMNEEILVTLAFTVIILNYSVVKKGYKLLLMKAPGMESLIALSSTLSFIFGLAIYAGILHQTHSSNTIIHSSSFFEASAGVLGFTSLGKYLEEKLKQKALKHLEELEKASRGKARIVKNSDVVEVNAEQVNIGDIVEVKTGDMIPVDGIVIEGAGYVDESLLTGESKPVFKKAENRDYVLAGSTLINGYMKIRTTRTGEDTVIARITEGAREAQFHKPVIQKFADKVVGLLTWIVIALAIIVAVAWYILTGNISLSLLFAAAVLAVTCPCPLGIAIPMVVSIGVLNASRKGILVRRGDLFERMAKANIVIFDKTGTLTLGEPRVKQVILLNNSNEEEIMYYTCSLEARSEHKLARALLEYCRENKYNLSSDVSYFEYFPGMGLIGQINEHTISIGNVELANRLGVELDQRILSLINEIGSRGSTPILVSIDNKPAAIVEVSDTLRPEAPEVIKALKELGFKVGLASGDIKGIVEKFREELKLDFAEGELRPMDKAEIIQRLQSNGGRVLFIGDGVNDAIAMSISFVGIAMGKASDIAKNSGDAILLTNDLRGILKLYDLSRKVNKLALENLIWAFIYNTTLIPIAAGALYPQYGIVLKPEWAALAMILSDITVILNSLRVGLSKAK